MCCEGQHMFRESPPDVGTKLVSKSGVPSAAQKMAEAEEAVDFGRGAGQ